MKYVRSDEFSSEKIWKQKGKFIRNPPDDRGEISREKSTAEKRRKRESPEFRCRNCAQVIGIPATGTRQRNHCPVCLHSLHLDEEPGDRASICKSIMEPIAIWVRGDEWALLHRCRGCGQIKSNRIAPDDNEILLLSLAVKPLGQPAFPLGHPGLWRPGG